MKKSIILFALFALWGASKSFAQQNALVAVLTHEGESTTFHGAEALATANEAAVDGDVITLSGGTFNGITVSKGITIRGAGMYRNDSTDVDRTTISSLTISQGTHDASIENLRLPALTTEDSLLRVSFYKLLIDPVVVVNKGSDMSVICCKVKGGVDCKSAAKVAVLNSIIIYPSVAADDSEASYQNCIVSFPGGLTLPNAQRYSSFVNCIFIGDSGYNDFYVFPETVTAKCCVVSTDSDLWRSNVMTQLFKNITNSTNTIQSYSIFKDVSTYTFGDAITYRLTDEAAVTYLGSDGTQIGIYGGLYPFDSNPHHPIITKSNVARRAADGKLHVSFEVNGNE